MHEEKAKKGKTVYKVTLCCYGQLTQSHSDILIELLIAEVLGWNNNAFDEVIAFLNTYYDGVVQYARLQGNSKIIGVAMAFYGAWSRDVHGIRNYFNNVQNEHLVSTIFLESLKYKCWDPNMVRL